MENTINSNYTFITICFSFFINCQDKLHIEDALNLLTFTLCLKTKVEPRFPIWENLN